jgi:hypothetical protein
VEIVDMSTTTAYRKLFKNKNDFSMKSSALETIHSLSKPVEFHTCTTDYSSQNTIPAVFMAATNSP